MFDTIVCWVNIKNFVEVPAIEYEGSLMWTTAQETYLANVSIGSSNPPQGENEARLVGLVIFRLAKRSECDMLN